MKEAILKYKVVFIRDQGHLDDQEQEAFASLLGKPSGSSHGSGKGWLQLYFRT